LPIGNAGIAAASTGAEARPQSNATPAVAGNPDVIELADDAAHKSGISVARPTLQAVRETIVANGVTAYNQDAVAQLSVRVPGHLWSVEKRVGQPIAKGDCLAVIDAADVGEAKTELLKAVVDQELKAKSLERLRRVAGEVAEKSLRQAEAEWRESRLRLISAQQRLINLGLPLKSDDLAGLDDDALADKIRLLGLPESIRNTLDPQLTTANLIPLTAPFDGVVIVRDAVVGEIVSPDRAQFVVADVSRMWIVLDVHKEDAGRVELGQSLEFAVDGVAAPVVGRIDWISTEMDEQTRTLRARAEVPNSPVDPSEPHGERWLKAHTFGSGRIVVREAPAAVVVPAEAVHRDALGTFVFVRRDGRFVRRNVRVGVADDEICEIQAGLAVEEPIAASGSHVLKAELTAMAAE
jgi:cobalt-zinc-cadmium efflux system membrane fusion protein